MIFKEQFMTLSKISILMLSTVSLLSAGQLQATSLAATPLKPTSEMLVKVPVPQYHIEKQAIHFSQAIANTARLTPDNHQYTSVSDEFWMEVSGKQLNQGIDLHVSQPESLIRLSAKRAAGEWLPDDHAIDPQSLELIKDQQSIKKAFSSKVTREQLAEANIFPNSSAVKISKDAGIGKFKLRVSKTLNDNQKYLINVKEKGSPYQQTLTMPQQTFLPNQDISFSVTLNKHEQSVVKTQHKAFIKTTSGFKQAVSFTNKQGQLQVKLPSQLPEISRGELYELHIESQGKDGSATIKRNGKIAFAVAIPTARMINDISANKQQALVGLEIASDGRYEVSGIIYGQDKNNKFKPLMHSASAYYLEAGLHQVALKFDPELFKNSSLKAPYELRNMRLKDQSRLSVLQQQPGNEAVSITTGTMQTEIAYQ